MFTGNHTIPAGSEIVLDIWEMHRKQKFWKFNANEFNPENFATENLIPKHSHAFLPFGAGMHTCIGT